MLTTQLALLESPAAPLDAAVFKKATLVAKGSTVRAYADGMSSMYAAMCVHSQCWRLRLQVPVQVRRQGASGPEALPACRQWQAAVCHQEGASHGRTGTVWYSLGVGALGHVLCGGD